MGERERERERVVLVTGASKGIGAAAALALARPGTALLLHYAHHREHADAVAEKAVRERGAASAHPVQGDFSTEAGVAAFFERVCAEISKIQQQASEAESSLLALDVLVNAATVFPATRQALGSREGSWYFAEKMFELTVCPVAKLTALCAPLLLRGRNAAIVNVVSVAMRTPLALCDRSARSPGAEYAGAMAAIDTLSRYHAAELAPTVRVNCVAPGLVDCEGSVVHMPAEAVQRIAARTPLRRAGKPEEIGDAIRFLADHTFITGFTLDINGGLHYQ